MIVSKYSNIPDLTINLRLCDFVAKNYLEFRITLGLNRL